MSDAEAAGDRSRTFLLVGLGIVAVAALVAFVIVPLLSGGGDDPDVVVDPDGDVVVADEDPSPEATPTDDFPMADPEQAEEGGDAPAETFEVFNARDPFDQLVEDEGADGTGDGTTPPGTTPPPPGTTPTPPPGTATPSPTPSPTSSPGTGPPPTGGDDEDDTNGDGVVDDDDDTNGDGTIDDDDRNDGSAEVGGTTVTLVDVFTDDDGERMATITVNGTAYTVGEGDTFARRFRLLDISGRCTTMLFGDSRFTLCEGERIRK